MSKYSINGDIFKIALEMAHEAKFVTSHGFVSSKYKYNIAKEFERYTKIIEQSCGYSSKFVKLIRADFIRNDGHNIYYCSSWEYGSEDVGFISVVTVKLQRLQEEARVEREKRFISNATKKTKIG